MGTIDKDKVIRTKKKKFSIKGFKKLLRVLSAKLNKLFSDALSYIKNAPRYVLIIAAVWFIILLCLLLLIFFCNSNNKKLAMYDAVVNEMNVAALDYVISEEIYPASNRPIKVTLEELVTRSYYNDSKVSIPETCSGYSVVFYNEAKEVENQSDKYFVESYINCKDFTSDDYNDYANN